MESTEGLLRAYFDAFNRQDIEGMLATLSEDVAHEINEGPTEVGKAAFRRFKERMAEHYLEEVSDLVVMASGERGAAEFLCSGTYLKTDDGLPEAEGQTYDIPAAVFVTVRQGKIARMTSYYNLRAWVAAVTG